MKILDSQVNEPENELTKLVRQSLVNSETVRIRGSQWITGKGKPDNKLSELGDFYIDEVGFDYYLKTEKGWESKGKLKGERGYQGESGPSAYQSWLNSGNEGTVADFISSLKGQPGEDGKHGRDGRDGKPGKNGVSIRGPKGDKGEDGREIELQKNKTHIQWRYVDEKKWKNLVALEELRGSSGTTIFGGGGGSVANDAIHVLKAGDTMTGDLISSGRFQTSNLLWSIRSSSGVEAIAASVSGDVVRRVAMYTNGNLKFSDGAVAADTTLARNTTGGLQLTNSYGTTDVPASYVLRITPTQTSSSVSTGGALFISNTGNYGSAINVYTARTSSITPLTVTANGATSVKGVNDIATYAFDWGDGNTTPAQAASSADHTYASPGTYTVEITVADTLGNTGTTSAPITVSTPTAPTAALSLSPSSGNVNSIITASAAASTQGTNLLSTYTFDWDDGSVTGPSTTFSVTHAYTAAGTYTVTLTVTASDGTTSTDTEDIVISAATANPTAAMTLAATKLDAKILNQTQVNSQSFNAIGQQFKYSGSSHAVAISHTSTGTNAQALNVVSTNVNDTAVGIIGAELTRGTVKITHTGTGTDSSASALSLRANGSGTAAQGIFFDAETGSGTTGAMQKFRNAGVDKWVIDSTGKVTTGAWQGTAIPVANGGTGAITAALGLAAFSGAAASSFSMNSQKITSLANGTVSSDAAAFGQIPLLDINKPVSPSAFIGAVGSTGKVSDSGHIHPRYEFNPLDHGILAWAYDPISAANSTVVATAGTVNVVKIHCPVATSVTNVIMQIVTAGITLTAGQCFAALYQSGSLIGTTADQATAWASTGGKTMALSGGPFAVAAGDVYVALFFNGITGPAFSRSANISGINIGLSAATSRFGTADTGRTTSMPGTLGTISALSISYWAAIS